jgi:class 3 adenylate cyclase
MLAYCRRVPMLIPFFLYSRLTGTDEDRTLARLRALRSDLIDPTIAVHNGRVVKRTGDGSLVEFRSVVDAVRCAIEVQNGMVERNAGLPPERREDDTAQLGDREMPALRAGGRLNVRPASQPDCCWGIWRYLEVID